MLEDDSRAFFLGNGNSFYELLFNSLADFFTSLLLQDDEVTGLRPYLHCLKIDLMIVGERR